MAKKIEISHRTIIFTVFFLILIWFLFYIREIILVFFIALLIMAILNPTVTRLSKFKIPRGLSVFLVYVLTLGLFGTVLAAITPPLIEQTTNFANGLPKYLNNLGLSWVLTQQIEKELISQIGSIPGQLVKLGVSVFSNILGVLSVLIFAFYLLIARNRLDNQLAVLFGNQKNEKINKLLDNLEKRLGGWARGELALMFLVGTLNFIGLTLLGIPFALPLALLAGLLEIVPNIGPVLAAIPAIIIGFSFSPFTGFATLALVFLIQQLENYIFVPKVMERSVGVSPVATLLALAIGFKIAGVVGILISVPVFISLQVLLKEYLDK